MSGWWTIESCSFERHSNYLVFSLQIRLAGKIIYSNSTKKLLYYKSLYWVFIFNLYL